MEVLNNKGVSQASANGETLVRSANPTIHEQVGVSVGLTGCFTTSSQVNVLVQLESNHAVPVPGNAPAEDLTADLPWGLLSIDSNRA